jgi:chromosome segregation ATPase
MSDYNTILNNIDNKLGINTNRNTNQNFYETQIKKDLPYFQTQRLKRYENGFSNGNDTFYGTSFNKTNPLNTYRNTNVGNLKVDESDTKSRKAMEKEMEPYLNRMKNELNYMMETFRKEIGNNIYLEPKLNSFEEKIQDNKKSIEVTQEDSNNKFNSLENRIIKLLSDMEKYNTKIEEMDRKIKEFQLLGSSIKEINFKIKDIENKTNTYDMTNEKLYNKIESSLTNHLYHKSSNIFFEINKLKQLNEQNENKINEIDNKYNQVNNNYMIIAKNNEEIRNDLQKCENDIKNVKIIFSNSVKEIETFKNDIENQNEKNGLLKAELNDINEKLGNTLLGFK